jgi:hypothetical protein
VDRGTAGLAASAVHRVLRAGVLAYEPNDRLHEGNHDHLRANLHLLDARAGKSCGLDQLVLLRRGENGLVLGESWIHAARIERMVSEAVAVS